MATKPKPVYTYEDGTEVKGLLKNASKPYGRMLADNEGSELECSIVLSIKTTAPQLLPLVRREWHWDGGKRAFDFAVPLYRIGIEAEGGTFSRGKSGHTSGVGYRENCKKYNDAGIDGWCILRFDTTMVKDDLPMLGVIVDALRKRGWPKSPNTESELASKLNAIKGTLNTWDDLISRNMNSDEITIHQNALRELIELI